jgi:hypothetical protein
MMTRRGLRASLSMGAFLMVLATATAPTALGAPPSLKWDPPAYDFGPVAYGSGPSEPHEFTLTNTGESQLMIKRWRSSWEDPWPEPSDPFGAASPSDCHILEPGESCSVELVFEPLHPGVWRGWQKVKSQIDEEPWTEVELTGEGTGPWVPLTPEHLAFESAVGRTAAPQIITLESQVPKELRIEGMSFAPVGDSPLSPAPFHVVGGTCHEGESIAPGQTCTIEVVMAPTVSGFMQSKLEITDNAPDSPQSVQLGGTATAAPESGQTLMPDGVVAIVSQPRACRKGKRRVLRKGRRICAKTRRHRQHSAHSAT